jgi:hypothetical protein
VSSPIFISYSSVDHDVAETICDALEARGHPCWIACRNVGPGENFQESIVKAIRSAKVMLLIFTSNANNSDEIKKELVLAGRHHVTVVPVRVEDVVPNDAFAYEFATRQWIDLFKDWEREIDRLGSQIEIIVATPKPGERAGATDRAKAVFRPRSAQKTSRLPLLVMSALFVATLGAGGLFLYTRPGPMPPSPILPPAPSLVPVAPAPTVATPAAPSPPAAPAPIPSSPAAPPPEPPHAAPQAPPSPASQPSTSASAGPFDGTWQTTITCPPALGALAVTFQFDAEVKGGVYHGHRGTEGQPGWLTLDGKIHPDGVVDLYANGVVGAAAFAAGNAPKGTPYGYHANGRLQGSSGTGHRVEGRPCAIDFEKLGP